MKAGVISFKIEGRLKTPAYVAMTTQTYRAALDAANHGQHFALDRQGQHDLAQTFSRGFTPGFLEGVNHQVLVQGRFPKSRGVRIGTVESVTRRGVRVRLDDIGAIKPGDGVVFDLGRPAEREPGGRVFAVHVTPTGAELTFGREALDYAIYRCVAPFGRPTIQLCENGSNAPTPPTPPPDVFLSRCASAATLAGR